MVKQYKSSDFAQMESRFRAALINSITGYKPANLIGTISADGINNLAIMSSVVHLGSDPALIGLFVRPDSVARGTLNNIRETGCYTVNHIASGMEAKAHQTAARYAEEESEFDAVGLTPDFVSDFSAPFVAESPVKMGVRLVEEQTISHNGVHFLIGKVVLLSFPDGAQREDGQLNLSAMDVLTISGLDTYAKPQSYTRFEYAKPHVPPSKIED